MYKRKAPYSGKRNPQRKYARQGAYTARIVPGYTRTSGFYGRYNRSSLMKSAVVNELKFKDTEINEIIDTGVSNALPATGTVLQIPTGTGPSDRIGRQISVKSIMAHLKVTKSPSTDSTSQLRLLVVVDSQANGTKPQIQNILATPITVNSFRNMAEVHRFKILYDKIHALNSFTIETTVDDSPKYASISKNVSIYKKVNLPIEYDASVTTGAITTIRSNNVLLFAICDDNLEVTINGVVRVRYDD